MAGEPRLGQNDRSDEKSLISPTEEFGFYPDRSGERIEAHF